MIEDDDDGGPVRPLPVGVLAGALVVVAASEPLAQWCAWRPWGGAAWSWLAAWPIAAALLFVGTLIAAAPQFVRPATRPRARQLLVLAAVLGGSGAGALGLAGAVFDRQAAAFVSREQPLADALSRYAAEHGGYPASLDSLVPRYLASPPRTGLPGSPTFTIHPRGLAGWELRASAPGAAGWDLVWSPEGRPGTNPRDRRLGDWWLVEIAD